MNAIDKVRQMVADGQVSQEVAEKYFPELKERGGVKIRERLIAFLSQCKAIYGDSFRQFELNIDEALDWLEKQGVMSEDEFRHIVGYLVQDIVANEHMAETEKQPTKFFVEKYYKKLRCKFTWKPSDAQMDALKKVVLCGTSVVECGELNNLFVDLKKLREEDI